MNALFRLKLRPEISSNVLLCKTTLELNSCKSGNNFMQLRFATKKAGGSTKNGRDSNPKYLGVKKFSGHKVDVGNIIVRQRGQKYRPGANTGLGKDHTIFALSPGFVKFTYCYERRRQVVSIVSESPYKNQNRKAIGDDLGEKAAEIGKL